MIGAVDIVQFVLVLGAFLWLFWLTKRRMLPRLPKPEVVEPEARSLVPCILVDGENVNSWSIRLRSTGVPPSGVRIRGKGFFRLRPDRTPEGLWMYVKERD